jgi:hypothetical protein
MAQTINNPGCGFCGTATRGLETQMKSYRTCLAATAGILLAAPAFSQQEPPPAPAPTQQPETTAPAPAPQNPDQNGKPKPEESKTPTSDTSKPKA